MEKRIRARQKAYFKRLYRKIAFIFMLLFCILMVCFVITKVIGSFSADKQIAQQVPVELNIPVFDLRVYCKEVSASVMPDMKREVYKHCINLESEAYFTIREMWDELPNSAKRRCVKIVRPGDGNYFLLRDCFLNEKEAQREDKKGQVRNYF
ncbi:hypothetical protein HNQ69_001477 [Bartonella callosciuri]|uniref:Uncharacterized protein n=1 Tax=Bartonella callosciuri TaxID=686223 RepID=A0A840NYL6_9HYPH|nr:hypothetical protein [Bartonella callosciuri]MBB5074339.1 hypothetical protein [Bartonella callosciuri]